MFVLDLIEFKGEIMYFLVNASPKPLDVVTSFCSTKRVFAKVYHRLKSSSNHKTIKLFCNRIRV